MCGSGTYRKSAGIEFLEGRASVSRSPIAMLLGRGAPGRFDERLTDNDFASIEVAGDDTVWVAYTGFSGDSDRVYADRVLPGQTAGLHGRPFAVSAAGGDVYRTAVVEDSEGKVWVIWSEQVRGNWDLYARNFDGESWGEIERLTTGVSARYPPQGSQGLLRHDSSCLAGRPRQSIRHLLHEL